MASILSTDINLANMLYIQMEQTLNMINQQIEVNINAQNNFNDRIETGASEAENLMQKVKSAASELFSLENASKVLDLSDEIMRTTDSIDSLNDGARSTQQLLDKIYASAQNTHTPYLEAADAIAKMGSTAGAVFQSSSELISFMDQFNKQCVIGSASAEEQAKAVESLRQGMAAGALDGGNLNAVLSAAPGIASAIEQSMGWAEGSVISYANQGAVTAEVVKNSLFQMADETNKKFDMMSITFGQTMTNLENGAVKAFQRILGKLNEVTKSEQFQGFVTGAICAMGILAIVISNIFGLIGAIGGLISDNWSVIEPLVWGLVAALVVYNAVLGIGWLTTLMDLAAKAGHAIASAAETVAIYALIAAQEGLNAALALCPVTWIIIAIIALIAVIFALCSWIAETTGIAESGFGVICGVIMAAVGVVWNSICGFVNGIIQFLWTCFVEPIIGIVEWILNVMNGGFDSFGDAVANLIGNVISWFLSLGKVVTKIIDAIFGTDWTSGLTALQDKVLSWGKNENAITLDRTAPTLGERVEYEELYKAGAGWGDGAAGSVSDFFDGLWKQDEKGDNLNDLQNFMDNSGIPDNLGTVSEDATAISEGTAGILDSLGVASGDLEYLRDIAEEEAINRFTTAEIKIEMNNHNNISQDTDLDGFIDGLTMRVVEALEVVREGV